MIILRILGLILFFLKEIVVANLQVASLVLKPSKSINPAIVKVPLDIQTDRGIFILTSMVTLTPGTLSLEVSKDRKFLYVHITHTDAPDQVISHIKLGFERKLMEVGC